MLNLAKICSTNMSDKPILKPREGPMKEVQPFEVSKSTKSKILQKVFYVSEGSLRWWQYIGKKVLDKLKRKTSTNILGNGKYRKYLFCLLYRYTYGAHHELEKFVDDYEYFKTDLQILNYNKTIINKIAAVRNSSSQSSLIPEI